MTFLAVFHVNLLHKIIFVKNTRVLVVIENMIKLKIKSWFSVKFLTLILFLQKTLYGATVK